MGVLRRFWLPALTGALFLVFVGSAWSEDELAWPSAMLLVVANTAPLLFVKRNPLLVVLTFAVTYPLWLEPFWGTVERDGHVLQSLPTLVALYATGAWERALWIRSFGLVTPAWMLSAAVVGWWRADVDELLYVALVLTIVWALGVVDERRRAHAEELRVRTRELTQAREELADQAVDRERLRIARELHDVVAHAISVITVQAGMGAHLHEVQPHRARGALQVIETTGREALTELRRMLFVLRPDSAESALPPQPGLGDLGALLQGACSAGLRVRFTERGIATPLAAGLDLAAYRIVQEGLTNAAKHAPGARVDVVIAHDVAGVTIEVRDHGAHAPRQIRMGHGLTGMSERVALYDGSLDLNGSGDGFTVRAVFPRETHGVQE